MIGKSFNVVNIRINKFTIQFNFCLDENVKIF